MKLCQSVLWAESERYAPGCQVSWWAMSYAVWRNEAMCHMPEDHKVDVLGMQHRDRWSISCVLTIHRPQLLCRNAQTANWYLSLNVLGYRYKKQGLCPCAQYEKIWEIYDYNWTKYHFHACARRGYVIYILIFKVLFITH